MLSRHDECKNIVTSSGSEWECIGMPFLLDILEPKPHHQLLDCSRTAKPMLTTKEGRKLATYIQSNFDYIKILCSSGDCSWEWLWVYLPTTYHSLQPWVSLGLLYNQSPLLSIPHLLFPSFHFHLLQVTSGLPFLLLEYSLPFNILFGIALSSILSTYANHLIPCDIINLTISSLSVMCLSLHCILSSIYYFPSLVHIFYILFFSWTFSVHSLLLLLMSMFLPCM
jgi:hypothetical protein